ncbi:MAG: diacylglycerol kinase [Rhodoferax sp.]|nr:diacylglycerol kinase [Rhodoferax sp.]
MNCGLGLAAELFSNALENALNNLSPERHPAIEMAKDCAAGAVSLMRLTRACVFITFQAPTGLEYAVAFPVDNRQQALSSPACQGAG